VHTSAIQCARLRRACLGSRLRCCLTSAGAAQTKRSNHFANQKVPAELSSLVDGHLARRVVLVRCLGRAAILHAWVNPTENWDQYEGFSFWVKGTVEELRRLEFITVMTTPYDSAIASDRVAEWVKVSCRGATCCLNWLLRGGCEAAMPEAGSATCD